jgi:hypothetical protein
LFGEPEQTLLENYNCEKPRLQNQLGGLKFEVQRYNPEDWEKVAGGRSKTKTTG